MKTLLLILVSVAFNSAFAEQRSYENYNEIVDQLTAQRAQKISTHMSVSIPAEERFQMIFGLTNSSTTLQRDGIGGISQNGFLLGSAIPLIGTQLFAEGFAKFYQSSTENETNASLQQYELRLTHKEPLSYALLNLGIGTSMRFMKLANDTNTSTLHTPSLLLTAGLERRVTDRMSFAGDLGYHHSLSNDGSGKNAVELVVRMNYHL
jgi:hypothetical protein